MYYFELLMEIYGEETEKIKLLPSETNEILAIIVAFINTARRNLKG